MLLKLCDPLASVGTTLAFGTGQFGSCHALKLAHLTVRLLCLNKLLRNKNVSQKLYSHGGEAFPLSIETYNMNTSPK
ncbi:hypothetical protein ACQP3J_31425, partial [Escherichia coli]